MSIALDCYKPTRKEGDQFSLLSDVCGFTSLHVAIVSLGNFWYARKNFTIDTVWKYWSKAKTTHKLFIPMFIAWSLHVCVPSSLHIVQVDVCCIRISNWSDIIQKWGEYLHITPFALPEHVCPFDPTGHDKVVIWSTLIHCWVIHARPVPHLVPSCTKPGLIISPGAVVKDLQVHSNRYNKSLIIGIDVSSLNQSYLQTSLPIVKVKIVTATPTPVKSPSVHCNWPHCVLLMKKTH